MTGNQNKTIRQKLMSVIMISIVFTLIFSSLAYYLIMEANNQQLYKQISANISLSSEALDQNFATIKQFSNLIVVDKEIQSLLAQQKDLRSYSTYEKAINGLNTIINIYHDHLEKYNVNYIMIEGIDVSSSTYISPTKKLPLAIKEDLLNTASTHFGQFKIITKYSNQYGLFIVHSIRRIKNAKLDYLGTLIININIDDLISRIFPYDINYNNILFFIVDELDSPIYYSDTSPFLENSIDNHPEKGDYQIVKIEGDTYLKVNRKIFNNWSFFSYLPYDEIRKVSVFFKNVLLMIIAVIGFISIISTDFVLRLKISKPIHELVTEMDQFELLTNHPHRILKKYHSRNDEIGFLFRKFEEMTLNISQLIEVNYKNEILYKESQIQYLRSQINPHFLYNTLDSINWRAKKAGDKIITEMVESLAIILRGALADKKSFTLSDEVKLIQSYLGIQKIRYGDSLSYTINCPADLLDYEIPSMVLQPLVENAIRYSIEYNGNDCVIFITALATDDVLNIEIRNSGSLFEENHFKKLSDKTLEAKGFGIGLLNIQERIQLKYGINYGISIYNKEEFASVMITIPKQLKENSHVTNDDC